MGESRQHQTQQNTGRNGEQGEQAGNLQGVPEDCRGKKAHEILQPDKCGNPPPGIRQVDAEIERLEQRIE
ncbi:hypothetical protein D3C76_1536340 [compost metagenome]